MNCVFLLALQEHSSRYQRTFQIFDNVDEVRGEHARLAVERPHEPVGTESLSEDDAISLTERQVLRAVR